MSDNTVTKSIAYPIGEISVAEKTGKRITISEREHFRIMASVFEEVITMPEHKSDKVKEALIVFSNKAHKKMFSPQAERLRVSQRVDKVTKEVLKET